MKLLKLLEYEPEPSWWKSKIADDCRENDHTYCKH